MVAQEGVHGTNVVTVVIDEVPFQRYDHEYNSLHHMLMGPFARGVS